MSPSLHYIRAIYVQQYTKFGTLSLDERTIRPTFDASKTGPFASSNLPTTDQLTTIPVPTSWHKRTNQVNTCLSVKQWRCLLTSESYDNSRCLTRSEEQTMQCHRRSEGLQRTLTYRLCCTVSHATTKRGFSWSLFRTSSDTDCISLLAQVCLLSQPWDGLAHVLFPLYCTYFSMAP